MRSTGRKKPQLVDTMEFKKEGAIVELYLDRNQLDFFAEVADEIVLRAPDIEALREAVTKAKKTSGGVEWTPVLKVLVTGPYGRRSAPSADDRNCGGFKNEVGVDVDRFWLGKKKATGKPVYASWEPKQERNPKYSEGDSREWSQHDYYYTPEDSDARRLMRSQDFSWSETRKGGRFRLPFVRRESAGSYSRPQLEVYLPYDEALWLALLELDSRLTQIYDRIVDLMKSPEGRDILLAGMLPLALPPKPEEKP